MRRHLSALAALTLAGSLAGASLALPATAATAPAATPASATRVAAAPQSPLRTTFHWNGTVRRGGTITYTIKSTNKGEFATDLAGLFGRLPRGISKARVVSKAAGTLCEIEKRDLFCIYDILEPNGSTTVKVKVWLKKSTKGTVAAEYAPYSIDVPAGVDITNETELDRLDIQDDLKYSKVKTRIVG